MKNSCIFLLLVLIRLGASGEELKPDSDVVENAALKYWPAFSLIPADSSPDATLMSQFNRHDDPGDAALPAGSTEAMRLLRAGAAIPNCQWGVRLDLDGINANMEHMNQARALAFYASYIAYRLANQGRISEAEENLLAVIAMGRHFRNPKGSLVEFFVGHSIECIGLSQLSALYPLLDPPSRVTLANRLENLRPASPISACIRSERQLLDWMVTHANDPGYGVEPPDAQNPVVTLSPLSMLHLSAREILLDAKETEKDYDALERLWSLPPEAFQGALKEFEKRRFNALSVSELPAPGMLWNANQHTLEYTAILIVALRSSDILHDGRLRQLGAAVKPGTPMTVTLYGPPNLEIRHQPAIQIYLGRHWNHHG